MSDGRVDLRKPGENAELVVGATQRIEAERSLNRKGSVSIDPYEEGAFLISSGGARA